MKQRRKFSFREAFSCFNSNQYTKSTTSLIEDDFKFATCYDYMGAASRMNKSNSFCHRCKPTSLSDSNSFLKNGFRNTSSEEDMRCRLQAVSIPAEVLQDPTGRTELRTITLHRQCNSMGYGFTLVGSSPVRVGKVDKSLMPTCPGISSLFSGDIVVAVNGVNVLTSSCDSVVQSIRRCSGPLQLRIQRWLDGSSSSQQVQSDNNFYNSGTRKSSKPTPPVRTCSKATSPSLQDTNVFTECNVNNILYSSLCSRSPSIDNNSAWRLTQPSGSKNSVTVQRDQAYLQTLASLSSNKVQSSTITVRYQDISDTELVRQQAIAQVLLREDIFYKTMSDCKQYYMEYLRSVLLPQDFNNLFFKIEQMLECSRSILTQVHETKIPFCGFVPSALQRDDVLPLTAFVDNLGRIYRQRLFQMCDNFRDFGNNLAEVIVPLLSYLTEDTAFQEVLRRISTTCPDIPSLNACLLKPIYHVRVTTHEMRAVVSSTDQEHPDYMFLDDVLQSLENCASFLPQAEYLILPSVALSTSYVTSSSGVSSDTDILESELSVLQSQLRFSPGVAPLELTGKPDRQLLLTGDLIFHRSSLQKVHGLLFSDMLLLTQRESNLTLTVIADPFFLEEISAAEFDYPQAPLLFHLCFGVYRILRLQAPNMAQKLQWKNNIAHCMGIRPSYNTSSRPFRSTVYQQRRPKESHPQEVPTYTTDRVIIA